VGLLGNVNDSQILHNSTLYKNAQYHGLFASNNSTSQHGFSPYLLGDEGYPLITGIMIFFKEKRQHTIWNCCIIKAQTRPPCSGKCFQHSQKTFHGILYQN
jgi:hypothetical protein